MARPNNIQTVASLSEPRLLASVPALELSNARRVESRRSEDIIAPAGLVRHRVRPYFQEPVMAGESSGGGAGSSNSNSHNKPRGRGRGRIASGARGRRGAFGGSITRTAESSEPATQTAGPSAPKGKGKQNDQTSASQESVLAERVTEASPSAAAATTADDDDDEDLCWICAEPVKLYSVGPCNHRTCHICALRLRALYKVRECTFCKASLDRLIFTTSQDKRFEEFTPKDLPHSDAKLAISFETREALQDTLILLRYNCPDERCDVAVGGWSDMKMHAKQDHHRLLCDLCITHKKIFAHEHTLHTSQSLAAHMKSDHRYCEYCHTHFYSDDELFVHMRDRHEQCHICKASGGEAAKWEYYKDYRMLEQHFRTKHFLCLQKDCLEQKFVVFASEMDLKAHQVEVHKAELSSKELQEAMRIEANFHYEDPAAVGSSSGRHTGGGRRSGGVGRRGRDREPEPATASDPLGLSSLALRANVPGAGPANHSRRIHFGGHTTSGSEATQQQAANAAVARASGAGSTTEERHAAFLAKVTQVLSGSEAKVTSFRSSVRAFRSGEMSANDLVDNIYSLVGDVDNSASVVHGLMDLLEDADKRNDVLAAWNKLRLQRTHFPSLVPIAGSGSAGSEAVRNVKSRSSASNSDQIWANVERAATHRGGGVGGGWGAVAGGMAARSRGVTGASKEQHFPTLGSASNFSSSAAKRNVPGSAAHSAASNGGRSSTVGLKATHGSTPWSTASSSTRVAPPSEPSPPVPYSSGSYPKSSAAKAAASTPNGTAKASRATSTAAFPMLPTNASAAALAAQRRAVLSNSSSRGGSGAATPTTAAVWGATSTGDGRIDSFPSPPLSRGTSYNGGGVDVNDLGARLAESSVNGSSSGGGGSKKKNKGVSMMSFGGVHRGN